MFILLGTMHLKSLAEPGFVRETLKNVTVPEGRNVLLSCTVKNLDGHKVRCIYTKLKISIRMYYRWYFATCFSGSIIYFFTGSLINFMTMLYKVLKATYNYSYGKVVSRYYNQID
jgi:hypothetical protein